MACARQGGDTVTVTYRGKQIGAQVGQTLRTVLLKAGVHPHNGGLLITCRGLGTCGTCAVAVQTGSVTPTEATFRESTRLNLFPHSAAKSQQKCLRLACQVRLVQDITVSKYAGFWGHLDDALPDFEQND